jgi:hypothetical protein
MPLMISQRTREEKAKGIHHTQKKEMFAGNAPLCLNPAEPREVKGGERPFNTVVSDLSQQKKSLRTRGSEMHSHSGRLEGEYAIHGE